MVRPCSEREICVRHVTRWGPRAVRRLRSDGASRRGRAVSAASVIVRLLHAVGAGVGAEAESSGPVRTPCGRSCDVSWSHRHTNRPAGEEAWRAPHSDDGDRLPLLEVHPKLVPALGPETQLATGGIQVGGIDKQRVACPRWDTRAVATTRSVPSRSPPRRGRSPTQRSPPPRRRTWGRGAACARPERRSPTPSFRTARRRRRARASARETRPLDVQPRHVSEILDVERPQPRLRGCDGLIIGD